MSPNRLPFNIYIEGPLGVGKSTLVKSLMTRVNVYRGLKISYIAERVELWNDWYGEDCLGAVIDNGEGFFKLQLLVLLTYYESFKRCVDEGADVIISERSPLSGLKVFTKFAYKEGKLTRGEYEIIKIIQKALFDIYMDGANFHTVCLWKLDSGAAEETQLNERVLMRDRDQTKNDWNKAVVEAYRPFFELVTTTPGMSHTFVDPFQPKEKVLDDCLENIYKTIDDIKF